MAPQKKQRQTRIRISLTRFACGPRYRLAAISLENFISDRKTSGRGTHNGRARINCCLHPARFHRCLDGLSVRFICGRRRPPRIAARPRRRRPSGQDSQQAATHPRLSLSRRPSRALASSQPTTVLRRARCWMFQGDINRGGVACRRERALRDHSGAPLISELPWSHAWTAPNGLVVGQHCPNLVTLPAIQGPAGE